MVGQKLWLLFKKFMIEKQKVNTCKRIAKRFNTSKTLIYIFWEIRGACCSQKVPASANILVWHYSQWVNLLKGQSYFEMNGQTSISAEPHIFVVLYISLLTQSKNEGSYLQN